MLLVAFGINYNCLVLREAFEGFFKGCDDSGIVIYGDGVRVFENADGNGRDYVGNGFKYPFYPFGLFAPKKI